MEIMQVEWKWGGFLLDFTRLEELKIQSGNFHFNYKNLLNNKIKAE